MSTKAPKKDPNKRIRKVSDRTEVIETRLTASEMDDVKDTIFANLDRKEELESQKKEYVKNMGAQMATVDMEIEGNRRLMRAGKRRREVVVSEWLTESNDIVRVMPDGQVVGEPRKARAEELQEKLFPEVPDDGTPEAAPVPAPDDAEGLDSDFGDEPGSGVH